jgi:tetratricopeptide (TPR) repeat protein
VSGSDSEKERIAARVRDAERLARAKDWAQAFEIVREELPNEPLDVCASAIFLVSEDPAALADSAESLTHPDAVGFKEASHAAMSAAVLLHLGKTRPALEAARQATALQPDSRDAMQLLAMAALSAGALSEAREASVRVVELAPEWATAHLARARQLAHEERYEEARRAAERSLDLDTQNAGAWHLLGLALGHLDELRAAVGCFWVATQLAPRSEEVRQHLAQALVQFESKSVRRHLPIGLLFLLGLLLLFLGGGRALLRSIGVPPGAALWLSVPPMLFALPTVLSLFRRFSLRELDPRVRDLAEAERLRQGRRSGGALVAARLGVTLIVVSYYVGIALLQYINGGKDFVVAVGFLLVIVAIGWLKSLLSKRDEHLSLRDQ